MKLRVAPEKAYLRDAPRRLTDAISREWERRLRNPKPDDYFKWPSTVAEGGDGGLVGQNWPAAGLLKVMGYTVGSTDGKPDDLRHAILVEVFSGHLPPVHSPAYMNEWGMPKTAARLRKMAESIAAFTRNAKRRGAPMDHAIYDWEHDLRFLYDKYYVGHFGFGWPSTTY
jgi:hypothetical protein